MALFSSAVHKFNYGMATFGGYPLFHVNPQQYFSPYSNTCYHSASSAVFTPRRFLCLPSQIRPKCKNFGPLMERWEGHYMDVNHKLQFHLFLKTPWIATPKYNSTRSESWWLWFINRQPPATNPRITCLVWDVWSVTAWIATAPFISDCIY